MKPKLERCFKCQVAKSAMRRDKWCRTCRQAENRAKKLRRVGRPLKEVLLSIRTPNWKRV